MRAPAQFVFSIVVLAGAFGCGEPEPKIFDGGIPDAGHPVTLSRSATGTLEGDGGLQFAPGFVAEVVRHESQNNNSPVLRDVRVIRFYESAEARAACTDTRTSFKAVGRILDIEIDRSQSDAGFVGTFPQSQTSPDEMYLESDRFVDGGGIALGLGIYATVTVLDADGGMNGSFSTFMFDPNTFTGRGGVSGTFDAPYCPGLQFWHP